MQRNARQFAHLLVPKEKPIVITAQIDSVSTCNTMPSDLIKGVISGSPSSKTTSRISTYRSQTMQTQGQMTLYCDGNGKLQTMGFLVVDVPGDKPPLLGGKVAQALGYLK